MDGEKTVPMYMAAVITAPPMTTDLQPKVLAKPETIGPNLSEITIFRNTY